MNIVDVIRVLGFLALLVAVGMGVSALARMGRNQGARGLFSTAIVVAVLGGLLITLGAGLVVIAPEERGVVITISRGGILPNALEPGIHWIIPFVQRVETYSIARSTYTMATSTGEGQVQGDDSIEARTKDG